MKPALIALLALTTGTSFSQWNTNGANIYNSNSGNVGIGTTTPSAPLDVAEVGIRIGRRDIINQSEQGYINLYEGTSEHGTRFYLDGSANKFILKSRAYSLDTDIITIPYYGTYANNVGIGTSSPDETLTVNGTAHFSNSTANQDPEAYFSFIDGDQTHGLFT